MRTELSYHIASLPLWQSALLMVVLPTALFMCGPVLVRRLFRADTIRTNNEVAGFKFATIGVIYAVLLGLAVIAVWEKFAEAEGSTAREAGALASLYRLSEGVDAPDQVSVLRESLTRYVQSVVEDDWPAMAAGSESEKTRQALGQVYSAVLALPMDDAREAVLLDAMVEQLDIITGARRERLAHAEGIVPRIIWVVLFIGAGLTLSFALFFGQPNLSAQVLMIGMLAFLIFLALFVAISIDHPFTGPVRIPVEAISLVLQDFGTPPR